MPSISISRRKHSRRNKPTSDGNPSQERMMSYSQRWNKITNNAIAPALRERKHKPGGGFGNSEFDDWMKPMSEIIKARRLNGKRRLSARIQRMREIQHKQRHDRIPNNNNKTKRRGGCNINGCNIPLHSTSTPTIV